jgi:probable rRNA maturation factor
VGRAMAVDVFAADEQRDQPVDLERWVNLARQVLDDRRVRGEAEVSLLFVDEETIASLNERFLGRTGPTDVLAFPIEDDPAPGGRSPDLGGTGPGSEAADEPLLLLGDVVVCPAVAARQAPDHDSTYSDEMALLVVHGLLHLLGLDHAEEVEAERMEALERRLLARFHDSGPEGAPGGAAAE